MRATARSIILPLGLLVACGGDPEPALPVSDALQADLKLAASGSVELASAALDDSTVLSAIERTPARSPERVASPRRSTSPRTPIPRPTPEPTPDPVPTPAPVTSVEEPEVVAEAPAPSDLPVATRPVPVSFPTGGGSRAGGASGTDEGSAGSGRGPIGVVIRGGGTGEDHCEIHTRRGRTGRGIPVVITIPARTGGMGVPTFPGRVRF
jgi:outer membrane biosynthesis protein TonB